MDLDIHHFDPKRVKARRIPQSEWESHRTNLDTLRSAGLFHAQIQRFMAVNYLFEAT